MKFDRSDFFSYRYFFFSLYREMDTRLMNQRISFSAFLRASRHKNPIIQSIDDLEKMQRQLLKES